MKPFKKFSMYDDQPTTASDSTGSNMKTAETVDKLTELFEKHNPEFRFDPHVSHRWLVNAAQAYADQQVNKVLNEAIEIAKSKTTLIVPMGDFIKQTRITQNKITMTEAIDRIQKDAENYFKNLKWMESWKFAPVKEAYTSGATYERNKAIDDCIKVLETYVCDMYLIPILESLKTKQP